MQRTAPRKAEVQQQSGLALPSWAALQERPCRSCGQQDEHRPTEERLWDQGLFIQEERQFLEEHTAALQFLHGEGRSRLCSALHGGRTRGNRHTLKLESFRPGTGKHVLPVRAVSEGTGCPERLHCLQPWKFSRSVWIRPWATCSGLMASPRVLDKSPPGVSASLSTVL